MQFVDRNYTIKHVWLHNNLFYHSTLHAITNLHVAYLKLYKLFSGPTKICFVDIQFWACKS